MRNKIIETARELLKKYPSIMPVRPMWSAEVERIFEQYSKTGKLETNWLLESKSACYAIRYAEKLHAGETIQLEYPLYLSVTVTKETPLDTPVSRTDKLSLKENRLTLVESFITTITGEKKPIN